MLPRLQIAVHRHDFRDFETLEYLATRIEQSYDAAKHYRAPPSADRSVLPDLAYRPPKKERTSVATAAVGISTKGTKGEKSAKSSRKPVATGASPAASAPASNENSTVPVSRRSSSIKCWNCEKTGHVSRECKETPRLHCHRCGKPNFIVRTCPTCSGNGEGSQ